MCEIDKYIWSMMSLCHDCENKNRDNEHPIPHSCKAYPRRDGIPAEIWNGENTECKCFIKRNA